MPPNLQDLLRDGSPEDALAAADAALLARPGDPQILFARATALKFLGRLDEARIGYDMVLQRVPGALGALNNRGEVLNALGLTAAALQDFDAALRVRPDYPPAQQGRAAALFRMDRDDEALAMLDRLLAHEPDYEDAWYLRALALERQGRLDEALLAYDMALKLAPDAAAAARARAVLLLNRRRFTEAAQGFAALEARYPDDVVTLNGLATAALHICDWSRRPEFERRLGEAVRAGKSEIVPGTVLGYFQDPQILLQEVRNCHQPPDFPPLWQAPAFGGEKIKLAYVSADFYSHAMPRLMAGLFERHDRSRFEVIAISFGVDDASPMRARLKAAFDQFHDVPGLDEAGIAALIAELKIDIAVDLMGFTAGARPNIFARRPAPVQVNYMGYAGTLGTAFHDYIIADAVVAPPAQEAFFSEKIIRLPDTYWATDDRRAAPGPAPSRAEAGLPAEGFVFCCFNNNWKIGPAPFDIWMRLLLAVPGSVLWLIEDNAEAAANLRSGARARGVAPERLVFAPRVSSEAHLARHQLADLFLDTLPYNAHTTASDALWCGVPLVTLPGGSFHGRVAASILHAMELDELVTQSLADYEALALALASDPARLTALKAKLQAKLHGTPLFDTARFTANMESAFETMRDDFRARLG